MNPRDILLRPIITEKAVMLQEEANVICFEVARDANKIEIKKAVEQLFNVKVDKVRVINRKGKPIKRWGRKIGNRPSTRKAYVKLAPGQKPPEFFEGI